MINKYIENYKNEIIQKTQELIQIPSVICISNNPHYPFGEPINNALEYMLKLGPLPESRPAALPGPRQPFPAGRKHRHRSPGHGLPVRAGFAGKRPGRLAHNYARRSPQLPGTGPDVRSEEHTSELQSR